ncbi:FHA domain-containing protein [Allokutzneria sp. NRRL B-24872]|uniref:FHA domain-containing protein n=1 Tax=Allokutzneria sp. NRRL B-24872 TaxID=1137961 RepID=UPI001FEF6726|nr:FHA domain-containing protein [Allokutzneria sp. NRRL B-24872]
MEGSVHDEQEKDADLRKLSSGHDSLAFGVNSAAPRDTLYALATLGGVSVRPSSGRTILFGRNRDDVHVCVGGDDTKVSRVHGELVYRERRWEVATTGKLPLRLPGSRMLFHGEEPIPLGEGYTPLFVRGSSGREHLLEVYVVGPDGQRPVSRHRDVTQPPKTWRLSPAERLALVVLGQRYLLHEARPQPLAWRQAADQLAELAPNDGWTAKRVEHLVVAVRTRLSRGGVPGLTREEVGEPVGNSLNDNLLRELMLSTTLVPPDLALLEDF